MKNQLSIQEKLWDLRRDHDYKLEEVAAAVNVVPATISKYENKENKEYIKELTEQTVSMDDVYKTKLKEELSQMKLKYENDIQLLKANYDEISNKKIAACACYCLFSDTKASETH